MAKVKKGKAPKGAKGGAKAPAKKRPPRPKKPKKQREPYSILIPFLVVLLVLIGIFDLTLAFYIWLNRDTKRPKETAYHGGTAYVETYLTPDGSGIDSLLL